MLYNVISFHIERNCRHWYASLSARCLAHCDTRSVSPADHHPVIIKYQREINTLYHPNQTITLKYPKHCCHQYGARDTSCHVFEIDLSYHSLLYPGSWTPTTWNKINNQNISLLRLKFIAILVVWLSVYNLRLHTLRPRQFSQSQHSYRLERYISVWLRFTNRDLIMGETSAGYISTYIPLWNVSMSRFSTSSSYDAAQFDIYLEYIYHNCYNHSVKGNHGIIMITL